MLSKTFYATFKLKISTYLKILLLEDQTRNGSIIFFNKNVLLNYAIIVYFILVKKVVVIWKLKIIQSHMSFC